MIWCAYGETKRAVSRSTCSRPRPVTLKRRGTRWR